MSKRTWAVAASSLLVISGIFFIPVSASAAGDAAAGKTIFTSKCAMCHGATGSKGFEKPGSDADFAKIIKGGKKPAMPAWASLSDKDIGNVVAYIRTLKK